MLKLLLKSKNCEYQKLIFMAYYCVSSENANANEKTKRQTATVNSLWFLCLLRYAELKCDWTLHNQHPINISSVNSK